MTAAAPDKERKSPETRLSPLRMLVLDRPWPTPDEYAEQFRQARPRDDGGGELGKRETPLARAMVEGVPVDGHWYLAAICYSQGQATALASHISRGGYGRNVHVARGEMGNKGKQDGDREQWAVLLKRTRHGRRAA